MQEKHYIPEDLIVGYLNNELSEDDKKHLEKWITLDESHKKIYYDMTEIWLASKALKTDKLRSDTAYYRTLIKIKKAGNKKNQSVKWIKAGIAVISGFIIMSAGFYWGTSSKDNQLISSIQTFEAPMGARSKTVLPDGSVVWLNAGSKLSYSSGFSTISREVNLIGQAYFEVYKNPKLPFKVVTDDIDVKVLGTKFDVKAYRDEKEVTVTLSEGSVEFINKAFTESPLVMEPLDQVVYDKDTKLTSRKRAPKSLAGHWIKGAHFFYELTLEQITRQLEKSFDVRFVYKNEEKKYLTFYADFNEDHTLDEILELISITKRIRYERRKDNLIMIY